MTKRAPGSSATSSSGDDGLGPAGGLDFGVVTACDGFDPGDRSCPVTHPLVQTVTTTNTAAAPSVHRWR